MNDLSHTSGLHPYDTRIFKTVSSLAKTPSQTPAPVKVQTPVPVIDLSKLRGCVAPPSVPLGKIAGVAAMRKDGLFMAPCPFVAEALALLDTFPLRPSVVKPFEDSPDSARYAAHVELLEKLGVVQLFATYCPVSKQLWRNGKVVNVPPIGTLSAVYKDDATARAIFNLKYINSLMQEETLEFSIPGIHQLIQFFILAAVPGMRFVHCDITSAFYEVPLGRRVSVCCCIRVGRNVYSIEVAPMGWKRSCAIMQAVTMGVVLFKHEGEDCLGAPEDVLSARAVPGLVRLEDGGGIACVYDSVLVLTTAARAPLWKERLARNFRLNNLQLKFITEESNRPDFMYSGIHITGNEQGIFWGVDVNSLRTWKEIVSQNLVASPRTLFSLLGYLRSIAPILGWRKCRLGRLTKAQSALGAVDWDSEEADLEKAELIPIVARAARMILDVQEDAQPRHRKSHILEVKRPKCDVIFIAVDATPYRWAVYSLKEGVATPWKWGDFGTDKLGNLTELPIDHAEACAMRIGLSLALATEALLVVAAGDNQVAGHAYYKGYSASADVDQEVVRASFSESATCVVLADIEGIHNIADVHTRPHEVYSEENITLRTEATWRRLVQAEAHWKKTGETYLKRSHENAKV